MFKKKNYTIYGDGEKTIVLLHGFLASHLYFKKLAKMLAAVGYSVVLLDMIGFGKSTKPKSGYKYQDFVNHVDDNLKEIGIDGEFYLGGHSMGGLVALRYTITHQDKVKKLILMNMPLFLSREQSEDLIDSTSSLYKFLLNSRYRELGWIIVRTFLYRYIGSHNKHSRELSLKNIIHSAEAFDDLNMLQTKTLLINGVQDREIYKENLAHLNNKLVRVIEDDMGHHSPVFNTKQIYAYLHGFLFDKYKQ